ncbi:MAG: Rpn family recombination-promoting nuclease/putative transposase [Okeania sp. SIO2F4]|uniref:Rpn family recombination-promoting nuclease/putative transposase n=1 Tax=Okeania sp. SIO2F4 TaxID=2607790 RepID=UPI00142C5ACC|nr:Rpn family recombination-promoting nuclease/putative transposase [Okeania sp. SIO2F4]NES08177.1 Rpn family recombination-promoting nuclease/putative transposase [Okeania sp. SIO2F4]
MRFINPKIDYAFKRIFGSDQSQEILISFLNAIIYNGESIIKSITIINPYTPGKIITLKETYLDIKAVLEDRSVVIIEMQIATTIAFDKRVAYNLSKTYANQLERGERYHLLNPVIAVTITDFVMFKDTEKVVTKFVFKEEDESFEYKSNLLRLIFVELPKFQKTLAELQTLIDKWIYFLKETSHLETIPEVLGEVPEIERALNIANQANFSLEELDEVDRRGMALQDERGRINAAKLEVLMRILNKQFGEISQEITRQFDYLSDTDFDDLAEAVLDFNNLDDLLSWLKERISFDD